jgi:hypothetical protein
MSDWNRDTPSRDWRIWLSLGMLALAGGLAIAKYFGEALAGLQTGGHAHTLYPAALVYAYGAGPIAMVAVGVCSLLGWVWVTRLRTRTSNARASAAVAIASVALIWIGWSALPRLFVGYEHVTSTARGGAEYQLGVRTALDGDDFFVVSLCPGGQMFCEAYGIAPVGLDERDDWSRIRLEFAMNDALTILTPVREIPVRLPR